MFGGGVWWLVVACGVSNFFNFQQQQTKNEISTEARLSAVTVTILHCFNEHIEHIFKVTQS